MTERTKTQTNPSDSHTVTTASSASTVNKVSESEASAHATARGSKKQKIYEQKFRDEWKQQFDFIEIDRKTGISRCNACDLVIKGSKFHIQRHANSTAHKEKYKLLKRTPKIENILKTDKKITLNKQVRQAEIKIVSFICKNNLPLSLVDELVNLIKDKVFDNNDVAKNIKLKRTKATQLATGILGPMAKDVIFEKLKKEKFSLIVDETTDISTAKSLVINGRFYNSEVGKVKDHFIDLIEVKDATATSLFLSIKNLLDNNKIPYCNIIGFGSYNANVMQGQFNSVQQKLSQISPGIVVQGCSYHSLHWLLPMPQKNTKYGRTIRS